MRGYDHFWQWCQGIWRSPGVEQHLLELQTVHGVVILEVLLSVWLARQGYPLNSRALMAMRAETKRWVEGVVIPLREQRIAWRAEPEAEGCREAIKKLELEAEHVLGELLYSAVKSSLAPTSGLEWLDPEDDAGTPGTIHNLAVALAHIEPPIDSKRLARLAALLMASQQNVNSH